MIGHGRKALEQRAAALLERPDLWRDWPASIVHASRFQLYASSWSDIVDYLKERGLVSPKTMATDVNVDRIVRAAARSKLVVDTN